VNEAPSTTEVNGRDPRGRFSVGNKAATGNPHAKRVAELRAALLDAVETDDVRAVVASLLKSAKEGDVAACRELLDRCVGKAVAMDLLQRIEAIEQSIAERKAS
jgi:hypothetical protein